MTCIIAYEYEGKVIMGGDSAQLSGFDIDYDKKIFVLGDFIIGHSGYLRFSQIIEYGLTLPEKADGEDDMRYVVGKLIPAIRQCAKDAGYTRIESSVENTNDDMLIGYHGKIYKVFHDFSVHCPSRHYAAIGCGQDYALGAMATFREIPHATHVESCIKNALEIAAQFSAGVAPPFYVLSK